MNNYVLVGKHQYYSHYQQSFKGAYCSTKDSVTIPMQLSASEYFCYIRYYEACPILPHVPCPTYHPMGFVPVAMNLATVLEQLPCGAAASRVHE